METIITSSTKTVRIGPDHPFVIIGERINPTGRKLLAAEMAVGDYSRVRKDALAQVEAGAHMLDVNAGIPLADEPAILAEAIRIVQSVTDVPLCIDSSIVKALESVLAAYKGKPLLNSVTGEDERLDVVLPLWPNTSAPSLASPMMRPASARTRRCALPLPRKLWNGLSRMGFRVRTC